MAKDCLYVVFSSLIPPIFASTVAGQQKAASKFVQFRNPNLTASAERWREKMI
jgi:hypothetical protein